MTVMMESSSAADHSAAHSYRRGSRRDSPTKCDVDDEQCRDRLQGDRQVWPVVATTSQDAQWCGSHADPCPDEHVVVPLGVWVQLLSDHS